MLMRKLRKDRHLTLEGVARKLGISYQQLQKHETGINRVSGGRLVELAAILDVSVLAFFPASTPVCVTEPMHHRDSDPQADDLAALFLRLDDPQKRTDALEFVQRLADGTEDL